MDPLFRQADRWPPLPCSLSHVEFGDDGPTGTLVVWGEHPWPPTEDDAEAIGTALCETLDELRLDGQPVLLARPGAPPAPDGRDKNDGAAPRGRHQPGGYGGYTDLDVLERLGMPVARTYERNRLRKAGLAADILDLAVDAHQPEALVFDTSTSAAIERALILSPRFDTMMRYLQKEFGISLEWTGFDILPLDSRVEKVPDHLVELKNSGVDALLDERREHYGDKEVGHAGED